MKFLKKLNLTVVVFCVCCIAFVAFLAYNPSHAYFQVHKDALGVNTTKVDLLFDKYASDIDLTNYTGPALNLTGAEWGTEANPYIIRKKNHINNLAMLQKAGYFEQKEGQSFFVVCDLYGKPVAINCSEDSEMEIAPIGTPDNPFTGNISGAYISGTATYGSYSVSQSTIANLTIIAGEETPDIGFFGTLGYVGTYNEGKDATEDAAAVAPSITPLDGKLYNATIDNLLFADITVTDSQIAGVFTTWWGKFADDKTHDANKETHHVGIVAGHSKWATLTNLSVYYSPSSTDATSANVAAFQLNGKSSNETSNPSSNYYSITGILGTLEYTNPTKEYDTNNVLTKLDGTKAISDEDLKDEIVTGGGGEEGGMLTGYMRAENIFNRKDAANTPVELVPYEEAYDVKYVTEGGDLIFKAVNVEEKTGFWNRQTYRYYYFSDSIFTFAMSARGQVTDDNDTEEDLSDDTVITVDNKIDYLIQIWKLNADTSCPVKISLTEDTSDWSHSETGEKQYLFKLTATSSIANNGVYVLAYRDTNGQMYIFNLVNDNGYVSLVNTEPILDTEAGKSYGIEYIAGTDGKYLLYNADNTLISGATLGKLYNIVNNAAVEVAPEASGYIFYPRLPVLDNNGNPTTDEDGYAYQRVPIVDADGNPTEDADGYAYKRVTREDENGNTVYIREPQLDANGNYVYDENGVQQYRTDAEGNPIYVYEYLYSDTPLSVNGQLVYANYLYNEHHELLQDKYGNYIAGSPEITSKTISGTSYPCIKYDDDKNVVYTHYTMYDGYGNQLYRIIPANLEINSFHVVSTNSSYYTLAFKHLTSNYSITSADGSNRFGITASPTDYVYGAPSIQNDGTPAYDYDSGISQQAKLYWFDWDIASSQTNSLSNNFTVSGTAIFESTILGGTFTQTYYSQQLVFDTASKMFEPKMTYNSNNYVTPTIDSTEDVNLLLFSVSAVTTGGNTVDIPAMNFETSAPDFQFDASKHVFFSNNGGMTVTSNGTITTDSKLANTTYTVVPIEQLKWNNGSGEYLRQLNHAVKLAQATSGNYQLAFKNLVGNNTIGNILDFLIGQNTGGVVTAPIGKKGETYYTIPAGMIAFDIQKAAVDDPSYINIIVAVNPEQLASSIGVHGPMSETAWNSTFDLSNPLQSFPLPVSTPGVYSTDFATYKTEVSSYYTKNPDESAEEEYLQHKKTNGNYYTYLGGNIVLVGYTFTITEPGIYLLGSNTGPMTVAYFSVDGAAGAGGDGTGGSPLGDVDFVYDNGTDTIITVDKKFSGSHIVEDEDPTQFYYPSYYYVRLMPSVSSSITIPSEDLKVRRYLGNELNNRRRYIKVTKTQDGTVYVGLLDMYEDNLDPNSTGAPPTS